MSEWGKVGSTVVHLVIAAFALGQAHDFISMEPSLAFIQAWKPKVESGTQYDSGRYGHEGYFPLTEYRFRAKAQAVAHALKQHLGSDPRWTLSFPSLSSYGATATHTSLSGECDIVLTFFHNPYNDDHVITCYDPRFPLDSWSVGIRESLSVGIELGVLLCEISPERRTSAPIPLG